MFEICSYWPIIRNCTSNLILTTNQTILDDKKTYMFEKSILLVFD